MENRGVVRNKVLISSSRANPKIELYRFDQDFQCIESSPNAEGKRRNDETGAVTYTQQPQREYLTRPPVACDLMGGRKGQIHE